MKTIIDYIEEAKQNFLVKGHTKTQELAKEISKDELKDILKQWALIVHSFVYDGDGSTTKEIFLFKTSDGQEDCGQEAGALGGYIDQKLEKETAERFKNVTSLSPKEYEKKNNVHIGIDCFYYKDLLRLGGYKIYDCRHAK